MGWLLFPTVVGLNIAGDLLEIVRADKVFSNLMIERWRSAVVESDAVLEEVLGEIDMDVEDTVVLNAPVDSIVIYTFDLAPGMKRKEVKNYGKMMASRNLGLNQDDILIDLLGSAGNKGIFVVARKGTLMKYVSDVMARGFPEPDIVVPDFLKFLYLTTTPSVGELLLIVVSFLQNYMAVLVFSGGVVVSVRVTSLELESAFGVIEDQFGLSRAEVIMRSSLKDMKDLCDFLKSSFENLAMEIDRETRVALRNGLKQLDISDLDVSLVYTEPASLEEPLFEAMKNLETFNELERKMYRPGINVPDGVLSKVRGALGLLVRGGYELGKVKSLRIKT